MGSITRTTTVRNFDVRDLRTHFGAVVRVVAVMPTVPMRQSSIARILLARLNDWAAAEHQAPGRLYCHQAAAAGCGPVGDDTPGACGGQKRKTHPHPQPPAATLCHHGSRRLGSGLPYGIRFGGYLVFWLCGHQAATSVAIYGTLDVARWPHGGGASCCFSRLRTHPHPHRPPVAI